jgi:para-aminobenzoate synthetase component 1
MERLSTLAQSKTPFLFYTDFEATQTHVYTLDQLADEDIEFYFGHQEYTPHQQSLQTLPLDFKSYKEGFDRIIEKIRSGETYLLNYTCETPIKTSLSLHEIFECANAPFKLRVKDEFVCFSPERFIQIKDGHIYTYPMKGTIDASLPEARTRILDDAKEMAEHIMVVDLLRNDLSMVAKEVKVNKFRYIDKIRAGKKELLQVSSQIEGKLGEDWEKELGTILQTLLPAGSISGTPKKSTLKIIKEVEGYERGYFSGVFGYYDGKEFDSAVMIRFIEKTPDGLVYKSGGGITIESDAACEYQEMQDKIYLP